MPVRLSEFWNDGDIQKPYSFGLAAQSDSRFNLAYEGYLLKETPQSREELRPLSECAGVVCRPNC
jgi:hypothetical protein